MRSAKVSSTFDPMKALKLRGKTFYVQTTNPQTGKQAETSLKTSSKKIAETRKNRFLTTLAETGSWDAAKEELLGKRIVKAGESPNVEQMKKLYTDFANQSAKNIRPVTITTNFNALRRLMARCNAKTVAEINPDVLVLTGPEGKKAVREIKQCKGVFKPAALKYYATKGVKVWNPFKELELPADEPKPYTPLPEATRQAIWNDCRELPADQAITILIGMGTGLRKNEIDKARLSWLTDMGEHYLLTVQEEDDFEPKAKQSHRSIPVAKSLIDEVLKLRDKMNPSTVDPYILAGGGRGDTRKDKTFRKVNAWLKEKGVKAQMPLHSMRKEFASNVMQAHGGEVAYKLTGHSDMTLFMKVYGGLVKPPTIDMGAILS